MWCQRWWKGLDAWLAVATVAVHLFCGELVHMKNNDAPGCEQGCFVYPKSVHIKRSKPLLSHTWGKLRCFHLLLQHSGWLSQWLLSNRFGERYHCTSMQGFIQLGLSNQAITSVLWVSWQSWVSLVEGCLQAREGTAELDEALSVPMHINYGDGILLALGLTLSFHQKTKRGAYSGVQN